MNNAGNNDKTFISKNIELKDDIIDQNKVNNEQLSLSSDTEVKVNKYTESASAGVIDFRAIDRTQIIPAPVLPNNDPRETTNDTPWSKSRNKYVTASNSQQAKAYQYAEERCKEVSQVFRTKQQAGWFHKDNWEMLESHIAEFCREKSNQEGINSNALSILKYEYNVAWAIVNNCKTCKKCHAKNAWICSHMKEYKYGARHMLNIASEKLGYNEISALRNIVNAEDIPENTEVEQTYEEMLPKSTLVEGMEKLNKADEGYKLQKMSTVIPNGRDFDAYIRNAEGQLNEVTGVKPLSDYSNADEDIFGNDDATYKLHTKNLKANKENIYNNKPIPINPTNMLSPEWCKNTSSMLTEPPSYSERTGQVTDDRNPNYPHTNDSDDEENNYRDNIARNTIPRIRINKHNTQNMQNKINDSDTDNEPWEHIRRPQNGSYRTGHRRNNTGGAIRHHSVPKSQNTIPINESLCASQNLLRAVKDTLYNHPNYKADDDIDYYIRSIKSRVNDIIGLEEKTKEMVLIRALHYGLGEEAQKRISSYPGYDLNNSAIQKENTLRKCFKKHYTEQSILSKLSTVKQGTDRVDTFFNKCYKLTGMLRNIKLDMARVNHCLDKNGEKTIEREIDAELYRCVSNGLRKELRRECFKAYQLPTRNAYELLAIASREEEMMLSLESDCDETEDINIDYISPRTQLVSHLLKDGKGKRYNKTKNYQNDEKSYKVNKCFKCREDDIKTDYEACILHNKRHKHYTPNKNWCFKCIKAGDRKVFPCPNKDHSKRAQTKKLEVKPKHRAATNNCAGCKEIWPCKDEDCDEWKKFQARRNKSSRNNLCATCKKQWPCKNDSCTSWNNYQSRQQRSKRE
tara:strand:+ start:485 stop:3049 length:2565 start_codon:yes stop_codon:yes gene_type:complete